MCGFNSSLQGAFLVNIESFSGRPPPHGEEGFGTGWCPGSSSPVDISLLFPDLEAFSSYPDNVYDHTGPSFPPFFPSSSLAPPSLLHFLSASFHQICMSTRNKTSLALILMELAI